MSPRRLLPGLLLCCLAASAGAAEAPSRTEVKTALSKATQYLTSISTEGGYLWWYSEDLKQRRGEEVATATQIWVQPPGTPSVGTAFLRAYEATGDEIHLNAALGAAQALVRGQLESGGWSYLIEFDPKLRTQWAYHVDHAKAAADFKSRRNTTTFDDNNTQSALRFLMDFLRTATNLPAAKVQPVRAALDFGLGRMLEAQYPVGAWPQRFDGTPHDPARHPVVTATFPTNWLHHWPHENYGVFYTLNDNAQSDCIHTMLAAYHHTGEQRFLDAARRGGEFLIRAQLPEPQPAWAQQYNFKMQPDWARAFEPPAVCASESGSAARTLIDLYLETGEERFLQPIPPFVAWLERAKIEPDRWARLYELQTNKPLYGDRDGKIHYTLEEISAERQRGYSWRGEYDLPNLIAWYEQVRRDGYEKSKAARPRPERTNPPPAAWVASILARQDEQGRWLARGGISMGGFANNIEALASFLPRQ